MPGGLDHVAVTRHPGVRILLRRVQGARAASPHPSPSQQRISSSPTTTSSVTLDDGLAVLAQAFVRLSGFSFF